MRSVGGRGRRCFHSPEGIREAVCIIGGQVDGEAVGVSIPRRELEKLSELHVHDVCPVYSRCFHSPEGIREAVWAVKWLTALVEEMFPFPGGN